MNVARIGSCLLSLPEEAANLILIAPSEKNIPHSYLKKKIMTRTR